MTPALTSRSPVAAVVGLSLLLGSCGGPAGPIPAARSAFLQAVHAEVPQANAYRSDVALVRLGEAACAELSSGEPFAGVVEQLGSSGMPSQDLASVVAAAADDLCPAYRRQAGQQ